MCGNSMRAADTNVLVRLLARDDPEQVASAEAFVAQGVWASHLVLVEAVWVLRSMYGFGPPEIIATVERLLTHKDLTIQDADTVAAALRHYKEKPKLGFTDCMILEIARKAGHLPLGTFDRNLSKLDGAQRL